jgi:AI-2E family transporter
MPIVGAIDSRVRLPRRLIILSLYVELIAGVLVIGYVVVPSLVKQVQQIAHDAPQYATDLRHNATLRHYDDRYHITAKLVRDEHHLPQMLGSLVGPLKDVTVQAASVIGQVTPVLAISFLLVLHGREYVKLGLSLTGRHEHRYRQRIIDVNRAVAAHVLGNVVISVLATIATWIVLMILGVPYALSLGLLIGFFDLIPLVGATLGAIFVGLATRDCRLPHCHDRLVGIHHRVAALRGLRRASARLGKALKVNPISRSSRCWRVRHCSGSSVLCSRSRSRQRSRSSCAIGGLTASTGPKPSGRNPRVWPSRRSVLEAGAIRSTLRLNPNCKGARPCQLMSVSKPQCWKRCVPTRAYPIPKR